MGGRRENRQEVGVLNGWEAGEIGENYTAMFCILQSKKGGGKRRKLRKKKGTGAENVRYSGFCFKPPPLPPPPPPLTDPPLLWDICVKMWLPSKLWNKILDFLFRKGVQCPSIEKNVLQGMSLWEEKERMPKIDLSVPNSIISPL